MISNLGAERQTTVACAHLQWMHHFSMESEWKHVPTRLLPRACLPQRLINVHIQFAWKKDGEPEDLLQASVRFGVFLTMENLKLMCARLGAEPATPGSGKRGGVIKIDYAKALVKKMFPDLDMGSEEFKRMVQKITWQGSKKLNEDEQKILDYVAELDEENRECPEFKRVAKLAKQELHTVEREKMEDKIRQKLRSEASTEEMRKKAEEEAAKAAVDPNTRASSSRDGPSAPSGTRKASESPPELRLLLHEKIRADPKIYITRDAGSYGYRAFYPSSLVECQHNPLVLV